MVSFAEQDGLEPRAHHYAIRSTVFGAPLSFGVVVINEFGTVGEGLKERDERMVSKERFGKLFDPGEDFQFYFTLCN